MNIIDTHSHIYLEDFDEDRQEMLNRAQNAQVTKFYLPAIDSALYDRMTLLEAENPDKIKLMIGLHPTYVQPATMAAELNFVKEKLEERSFAAIGEIGIDLYWDQTLLKEQQEAFSQQIDWAIAYDLPIVIHMRSSFDEVYEVLKAKKHPKLRGISHCFSGTLEQAQQMIDLGFLLGIGGVVTFKNGKIDQFLHQIPLEHIVLETDAPYLAPVPYRGKRNEPAYLVNVVAKLSEIYQLPQETIIEETSKNAKRIFAQ